MHDCLKNSGCEEPIAGSYFISTYPPFSTWKRESVPLAHRILDSSKDSSKATPLGLYIHIPFCVQRCSYCYYLSFDNKSASDIEKYFDALVHELELYKQKPMLANRQPEFVYFGGGTPSLPNERLIEKLIKNLQSVYSWENAKEVTFECAPNSVTQSKLRVLKQTGVTRISMGIQTFDDDVLRRNGRVHLSSDVERAYETIRKVGFDVVNIDLIVGLPGETDDVFYESVRRVIQLEPECVTIYQLEIPLNTPLYRNLESDSLKELPASWDTKRNRLVHGFEMLTRVGYSVCSAYAAIKDPVKHRFVYQDAQYHGADLLGIGVASFSYLQGVHYQNQTSYDSYIAKLQEKKLPIHRAYELNVEEQMVREFILQLKLGSVDADYFQSKFSVNPIKQFANIIEPLEKQGWIESHPHGLSTTPEGLLHVDHMIPTFYLPKHKDVRYS